jgi:hypothetical protein
MDVDAKGLLTMRQLEQNVLRACATMPIGRADVGE